MCVDSLMTQRSVYYILAHLSAGFTQLDFLILYFSTAFSASSITYSWAFTEAEELQRQWNLWNGSLSSWCLIVWIWHWVNKGREQQGHCTGRGLKNKMQYVGDWADACKRRAGQTDGEQQKQCWGSVVTNHFRLGPRETQLPLRRRFIFWWAHTCTRAHGHASTHQLASHRLWSNARSVHEIQSSVYESMNCSHVRAHIHSTPWQKVQCFRIKCQVQRNAATQAQYQPQ